MIFFALGSFCINALRHVRLGLAAPLRPVSEIANEEMTPTTQVRCAPAVILHMEPDKLPYTDTRSALNAAEEALALICRLRRISIDSLSDAELGEFYFNALEDELGGGALVKKSEVNRWTGV